MKTVSSVLLCSGLLLGSACNPLEPGQPVVLGVSKLDAPTTVAAGSTLTVVLTVETGGCVSFDRIEVTRDASGANLTAWGVDISNRRGTVCPDILIETPHRYDFKPPFQSPFTIQVQRGRLSPLTATVQVQ
jgi:hypothetical protein